MSLPNPSPSRSASALVTLNGVAARTPDGRTLFDNLTLAFGAERTGVVGRNGVGKTTLLDLISGHAEPAEGTVTHAARIGRLDQRRDPMPGETAADRLGVSAALEALTRILAGQGSNADLDAADWTLEARLDQALADVGLSGVSPDRAVEGLSGGERTRLDLAALLLDQPDLLVLDEPTNHLDADGRAAISGLLQRWKGGAVVVSHDRALLEGMDRIVELTALGASVHGGGYSLYAQRKALERAAAEHDLETAEKDLARVKREGQKSRERQARRDAAGKRFADSGSIAPILAGLRADRAEDSGGRAQAVTERRRAAAEASLEEARERVERVRALSIPMPSTGLPAGRLVLELADAAWATPQGRPIVGPLNLSVSGPERIAVCGPNGAGKTTLLRLIAGELEPTSGRVHRPVRAAMLDQQTSILKADETLLEAWLRLNPGGDANGAHAALARFLFRNTAAHRTVETLSGGERLRAALACVMTGPVPPQLLVLDEPTNHLDLDAIEAVEAALCAYDGALIVVSHDAAFLEAIGAGRRIDLYSLDRS